MNFLAALIVSIVALIFCARVTSGDGNFICDGFTCPKNTQFCNVNARNDPSGSKQVIRQRQCLSENGKVLQEQVVKIPFTFGTGNSHAFAYGSGGGQELTSEEARNFFGPPDMRSSAFGGYWYPGAANPMGHI